MEKETKSDNEINFDELFQWLMNKQEERNSPISVYNYLPVAQIIRLVYGGGHFKIYKAKEPTLGICILNEVSGKWKSLPSTYRRFVMKFLKKYS